MMNSDTLIIFLVIVILIINYWQTLKIGALMEDLKVKQHEKTS